VRAFSSATSRLFLERANRRPDDFPPTIQEGPFTYLVFLLSSESLFLGHFQALSFLFSGHEPIYFTENKEKTLRVSYDRDTHTIEYMN
jgi:hypothetical protein